MAMKKTTSQTTSRTTHQAMRTRQTTSGYFLKIVAVFTALMLVFLQFPSGVLTHEAIADAVDGVKTSAADGASVDVPIEVEHAFITYKDQVVPAQATKVTIPAKSDFEFEATPDSGYQLESVTAKFDDKDSELTADKDGVFKLTAAEVAVTEGVSVIAIPEPVVLNDDEDGDEGDGEGEGVEGAEGEGASGDSSKDTKAESEKSDEATTTDTTETTKETETTETTEPDGVSQDAQNVNGTPASTGKVELASKASSANKNLMQTTPSGTEIQVENEGENVSNDTDTSGNTDTSNNTDTSDGQKTLDQGQTPVETAISEANAEVSVAVYASADDRAAGTNSLSADHEIGVDDTLYGSMRYEFKPGEGPQAGRLTYTYTMPADIVTGDRPLGALYDSANNVAGEWKIENNKVFFYYTEAWAVAHPNGGGSFSFDFTLNEERIETGSDNVFNFPGASSTITVKVRDGEITGMKSNEGIAQDGTVSYTVNLHAQKDFSRFIFSDHLESSLNYVEGSFKFDGQDFPVEITANADGSHDAQAAERSIAFGNHVITYQAQIVQSAYDELDNGQELGNLKNTATWQYGDGDTLKTGSDESLVGLKKNLITKSNGNTLWKDNRLMWKIDINHTDGYRIDLSNYTLTDALPEGMRWPDPTLDDNFTAHFDLYRYDPTAPGGRKKIEAIYFSTENRAPLTYTFPADAGRNAYHIEYYVVLENIDINKSYTNTALLTPPGGGHSTSATSTYTRNNSKWGNYTLPYHPEVTKEVVDQSEAATTGIVHWYSTLATDVYPNKDSGYQLQFFDRLEHRDDYVSFGENATVKWKEYWKIWFVGKPRLSCGDIKLVEKVDYKFPDDHANTFGYTNWKHNYEGEEVPVAMRIQFNPETENMQKVIASGVPIDIYYETQCDGTVQTYRNEACARITAGNDEKFFQSVWGTYELEGVPSVVKTGDIGYDVERGKYVATWNVVANKDKDGNVASNLKSPFITFVDTLPVGMSLIEDSVSLRAVRTGATGLSDLDKYPACTATQTEIEGKRNVVTFTSDLTKLNLSYGEDPFYNASTGDCYAWFELRFQTELDPASVVHDGTEQVLFNKVTGSAGDKQMGVGHAYVKYTDTVLNKYGEKNEGDPVVHYAIEVNPLGQKLDPDATHTRINLKDTLDYRTSVVLSSIKILDYNTRDDITDQCTVTLSNDETDGTNPTSSFTVDIPDGLGVIVKYDVILSGEVGQELDITNKASLQGITDGQVKSEQNFKVTHSDASVYGNSTIISITKTDSSNVVGADSRLPGAQFDLYKVDLAKLPAGAYTYDGLMEASERVGSATTDASGTAVLIEDDKGSIQFDTLYFFKEVKAPAGYAIDDPTPHFAMTQGSDYDAQKKLAEQHGIVPSPNTAYNITDTKKTSTLLKAQKVFEHGTLTEGQFAFELVEGDEVLETKYNDENGNVSFSDIEYDAAGTHEYTIREVVGTDPGVAHDPDVVYDEHSEAVTVTVVNDGWGSYQATAAYAGGGDKAVFTNRYNPHINISGVKAWEDGEDQDGIRPSEVTVKLLANNVDTGKTAVAKASEGWSFSFTNLEELDSAGKPITYTVTDAVDGYEEVTCGTADDGSLILTNKHMPETTRVPVTKVWDDAWNGTDDFDGLRPTSVTVQLYADEVAVEGKTLTLSAANNWADAFTDLPKYKDRKVIKYTVGEGEVKGYTPAIAPDATGGFVITNTHAPEFVSTHATKVWDDAYNQDGKRTDEVTVQLMANNSPYGEAKKLSASNEWRCEWTGLPKIQNGSEVRYDVVETDAPWGYTSTVTGSREAGFVVKNSYTPGVKNITVSKAWDDVENHDGMRPSSVKVTLFADGERVGEVELNERIEWKYTWKDLAQMKDGKDIVYTVGESVVPARYTATVTGVSTASAAAGGASAATPGATAGGMGATIAGAAAAAANEQAFVVTNTHVPETISKEVTKTWDDADDQDGIRPEGVKITLYADDEVAATHTLTADEGWKYTFSPLDKYRSDGKEIVYTVGEDDVEGYAATIEETTGGFAITNKHVPKVGSIDLFAMKTLEGRTLAAEEFSFELLEKNASGEYEVIQTTKNAGDGHARFETIEYKVPDIGTHAYMMREVEGDKGGVTYDTTPREFTVEVAAGEGSELVVTPHDYDPATGIEFTNTYAASGKYALAVSKLLDGSVPPAGAYQFELKDALGKTIATASNDADGRVVFPEIAYDGVHSYKYTISEVVPEGAKKMGNDTWTYNGIIYDTSASTAVVEGIDNFDGTLRFKVTYDGNESKTFNNATAPTGTFPLTATKVLQGRDFRVGDSFTFTVSADEGAPLPERPEVTVTPTGGTQAAIDFGAITFTTDDLGNTYTYTIREAGAGETAGGITNDPFAHVVKLTVGSAADGSITVLPEYQNGATGITFTNTYRAAGEAQITAQKMLSGRELAADEFYFELTGDNLPATLHASAAADGTIAFAPIAFTQEDAGHEFHYTISETQGTLGGVTYDTATHDVTVRVSDNGDGTLAIAYDYGEAGEAGAAGVAGEAGGVPVFQNSYKAASTSAQLTAHKAFVGGTLEGGDFTFELTGTSANAAATAQTATNDAEGTVTFDAIDYDAAGVYEYRIAEVVPAGATDNGDGTFTGADGVVYDGTAHTATVTVADDGYGKLVAAVAYDDNASGISFGNTALVRTGFTFTKHFYGGVGTFDFKLTAVDAQGASRTGQAADYSDAATILDDGSQAFTATVQNGAFTDGEASIVFPKISYASDGDYYYLIEEDEESTAEMTVDEAQYLAHVVVSNGQVTSQTFELLYGGENLGATDDLAFYNNAKVSMGLKSMKLQGQTAAAERVSVYPKAQKYLNGGTDQLVGGDFTFELAEQKTGSVLAVATNDEVGQVAFFDESSSAGLVYDEPGTFRYTLREVAGNDASITYDSSVILLTVEVTRTDNGLEATTTYNGPGGSEPAFYNTQEGMDITVQKVSRSGGEGLAGGKYALWVVNEGADLCIGEAESDANGYITFKDVKVTAGQKYYFQEVVAPKGHTLDKYRTAYFSLNEAGDALELVEDTASDGWHSATENIERDGAN